MELKTEEKGLKAISEWMEIKTYAVNMQQPKQEFILKFTFKNFKPLQLDVVLVVVIKAFPKAN